MYCTLGWAPSFPVTFESKLYRWSDERQVSEADGSFVSQSKLLLSIPWVSHIDNKGYQD